MTTEQDPTTTAQWKAVREALHRRDMVSVVALLHPLAISDPRGVELFMAVVAAANASPPSTGGQQ